MSRKRTSSMASGSSTRDQELDSMYDYLVKIVLLGPSGTGKSCILHRFVKSEWRILSSQTIGVEFASKVVRVGTGQKRKRIKLQLWDTAGTERFRAVSRSYYRGAAGALLIYDVCNHNTFRALPTFLNDARALASPNLVIIMAGNKSDLAEDDDAKSIKSIATMTSTNTTIPATPSASSFDENRGMNEFIPEYLPDTPSQASVASTIRLGGTRHTATIAVEGREVLTEEATRWASTQGIPVAVEVSALSGGGVEEAFTKLAEIILAKIELGEIDPDDPASGIQYGDSGWNLGLGGDSASIKSGFTIEDGRGHRSGIRVSRHDGVRRRGRSRCC